MKIYSENEQYKLYQGNMLDMLDEIKENSIDSIVTDPPYELNFMGKGWDNTGIAFQPDTWKKCFEVLKPGGHLLAFGGSRTYHRIACAIEDAGFEIRDCIMWLYGCLSNDTEILTSNGWRNSETIQKDDEIYSLDLKKNVLIKNKVKNVFKYDYDGEMVNLKNANTNQLLTPNHHCIVNDKLRTRVKGETKYNSHDYWCYKDAWQIKSETTKLPLASSYNGKIEIGNLFAELLGWIISEGTYSKDTNAIIITQSDVNKSNVNRIKYILGKLKIKYSEYTRTREYKNKIYTEYDFYIGKQSENVVNTIKDLAPEKKLTYKLLELSLSNKEFLLKGLCAGDGAKAYNTNFGYSAFYQKDIEQLEIFQILLHMTNKQGWINKNKYCCSIHSNPNTELQGKHFKDRFVKYDGKYVWCIETEIGNFIAKRDGKIFITGNSGFPKSMNIGLAIDKKNGVDNETGNILHGAGTNNMCSGKNGLCTEYREKIAQNEWQGWGTQLKPAYEPIVIARKPVEGSIVDNVIKWGVGGINIDECRISHNEPIKTTNRKLKNGDVFNTDSCGFDNTTNHLASADSRGRFPANIILDGSEESTHDMPMTGSGNNGEPYNYSGKEYNNKDSSMFNGDKPQSNSNYNDNGSAARYFYCAKASKKDRDEGLVGFEEENVNDGQQIIVDNAFQREKTLRKNIHPTVKPVELMQYLIRLVTPNGGTVLDPFNGSGSTGKAVMYENKERNKNFFYIGIELTPEYLPISKARIEYAQNSNVESIVEVIDTTTNTKTQKKITTSNLFDF